MLRLLKVAELSLALVSAYKFENIPAEYKTEIMQKFKNFFIVIIASKRHYDSLIGYTKQKLDHSTIHPLAFKFN